MLDNFYIHMHTMIFYFLIIHKQFIRVCTILFILNMYNLYSYILFGNYACTVTLCSKFYARIKNCYICIVYIMIVSAVLTDISMLVIVRHIF